MRTPVLVCIAVALGISACSPAPNKSDKPAAPPPTAALPTAPATVANARCPDFKITYEIGKEGPHSVSLTLVPEPPSGEHHVFWNSTAGNMSGDGLRAVVRDLPEHIEFTVAAEIDGMDPACARGNDGGRRLGYADQSGFASATVQMP